MDIVLKIILILIFMIGIPLLIYYVFIRDGGILKKIWTDKNIPGTGNKEDDIERDAGITP